MLMGLTRPRRPAGPSSSTSSSSTPARSWSRRRSGRPDVAQRPAVRARATSDGVLDAGFWLVRCVVAASSAALVLGQPRARRRRVGDRPSRSSAVRAASASASAAPVDVASYLLPAPRAAPPIELTAPDGAAVLARLAARRADLRLLRLHPLPGRLPGDDRHGRAGDGGVRAGAARRLRERRPRARHAGLADRVRPLPAGRVRRPDRDGRPRSARRPTPGASATRGSRPARPARTRCRTPPTSSWSTPPGPSARRSRSGRRRRRWPRSSARSSRRRVGAARPATSAPARPLRRRRAGHGAPRRPPAGAPAAALGVEVVSTVGLVRPAEPGHPVAVRRRRPPGRRDAPTDASSS